MVIRGQPRMVLGFGGYGEQQKRPLAHGLMDETFFSKQDYKNPGRQVLVIMCEVL